MGPLDEGTVVQGSFGFVLSLQKVGSEVVAWGSGCAARPGAR